MIRKFDSKKHRVLIHGLVFCALLVQAKAQNIFVQILTSSSAPSTATIAVPAGNIYDAAAPMPGATWNTVGKSSTLATGTGVGTYKLYTSLLLKNSTNILTAATLTVSYVVPSGTTLTTEPAASGGENTIQSGGVMQNAWRNYDNGAGKYFIFAISNLPPATPYGLYFYGGTTTSGQGVGLALTAANALTGSATTGFTTNTTANSSGGFGSLWTVSGGSTNLMPKGTTWNTLYGQSDASGAFTFLFNGGGSYAYLNGFQIVPLSAPGISGVTNQTAVAGNSATLAALITGLPAANLQWRSNSVAIAGATNASLVLNNVQYAQNGATYALIASNLLGIVTNSMTLTVMVTPSISGLADQAVSVGSTVTISPTVSGVPSPATHWQLNGAYVADGSTGNGSTLSGSATSTLVINNAQSADSGIYSLVASNNIGMVTNGMTLTVSAGNVAPAIIGPVNQTAVQTSNATFTASVSGLPLPALQWLENGMAILGQTNASLTVSNVQYSQNGYIYSIVATNLAGMTTNSANLFVLVPPVISGQPTNLSVAVGASATFNVTASGVPSISYQWYRNSNLIANATGTSYTIASAKGSDNGVVYSVVVSNNVGTATSTSALLTVLSTTLTGTFLPTNGAVNISPDQQLRIVFSGGTPVLAYAGKKLYVYDASNNSLFATIDTGQFQTFLTDSATVSNAFVRTEQGNSFYYMPIAIYGNEAWITLNPANRLAYGKTYYVTCDAGLFLDSTGAAFPGISGAGIWQFSTKAAGPATPTASTGPTNITIGLDGGGDFATLQGASDWIPQNNTLKRTITIQPGIYHDFAIFTQNRNFVTVVGAGTNRQAVQIIYPNAAYNTGSSCGMLRVESSDMYFRNFTLDNQVYLTNSLDNYGPWAGRLNTLDITGNRLIFDNVIVKGGQDTLFAIGGIAYYNRCEVWGSTDFIYGGGLAVFDQCNIVEIKSTGGPCTAPSTTYAQPYNLIFSSCNFPQALVANGYPYDVSSGSTTFMRPWGQDGMTVIINCSVGSQISGAGWGVFGSGTETTCRARELGTTLIVGGAVNVPQVRWIGGAYWVNTLDPDYTNNPSLSPTDPLLAPPSGTNNRVVVTVNQSDYTIPTIFGNAYFNLKGWQPTVMPTITNYPTNQIVNAGSPAVFSVAAVGLPDPTYQWQKNGTNIIGATNATFVISSAKLFDHGAYSVIVSNSAGVLASGNAVLTVPAQAVSITSVMTSGVLNLSWPINETGFHLFAQTNPPGGGLTTNWLPAGNFDATNQATIPINTTNGSVFFRLIFP